MAHVVRSLVRCSRRALSTSTDPAAPEQLAGTAPAHRLYVFLHTPQPPSTYPAKFSTPVQRELLLATAPHGGAVNFAWSPSQPVHPLSPRATTGTGAEVDSNAPQTYHLTAFSRTRGKLEINAVSLANMEDVGRALRTHASEPPASTPVSDDIHLYVCTHGARDCRCGETGSAVAHAIQAELERRRLRDAADPSTRVRLSEVAHVGGHKYAANVLVYPHGEWLGKVTPKDVSEILDAILAHPIRPMRADEMPICPLHWRGRMGLSKDEQMQLFNRFFSDHRD